MRVLWPLTLIAVVATMLVVIATNVGAAPAENLDRCANDTLATVPRVCDWRNGNLNSSNSEYSEGSVVAYRLFLSERDPIAQTVNITYDFTKGGVKAIDFLTTSTTAVRRPAPVDWA